MKVKLAGEATESVLTGFYAQKRALLELAATLDGGEAKLEGTEGGDRS